MAAMFPDRVSVCFRVRLPGIGRGMNPARMNPGGVIVTCQNRVIGRRLRVMDRASGRGVRSP